MLDGLVPLYWQGVGFGIGLALIVFGVWQWMRRK